MLQLTTILFLITSSVWAVLHNIAVSLFFYWHFWWFDLPMHFFGGSIVALGVFTLFDLRLLKDKTWLSRFWVMVIVIGFVAVWEVYEVVIGVPVEQEGYVLDTSVDVLLGILGGLVGHFVGSRIRQLN